MVVQHNLRAMNSNRMLGLTANVQSKSTEKLSSGYKINRAADDAAGLSISEKMRKQIRGLSQASLNASDGISAVQTAEGALNEVQDMLQRMNELAVKASNGSMSESDRSYIQNEVDALLTEIDRVAETTKFNETYLLKGANGTKTEYLEAHDAGIKGELVKTGKGKATFTMEALEAGDKVNIGGKDYTIIKDAQTEAVADKDYTYTAATNASIDFDFSAWGTHATNDQVQIGDMAAAIAGDDVDGVSELVEALNADEDFSAAFEAELVDEENSIVRITAKDHEMTAADLEAEMTTVKANNVALDVAGKAVEPADSTLEVAEGTKLYAAGGDKELTVEQAKKALDAGKKLYVDEAPDFDQTAAKADKDYTYNAAKAASVTIDLTAWNDTADTLEIEGVTTTVAGNTAADAAAIKTALEADEDFNENYTAEEDEDGNLVITAKDASVSLDDLKAKLAVESNGAGVAADDIEGTEKVEESVTGVTGKLYTAGGTEALTDEEILAAVKNGDALFTDAAKREDDEITVKEAYTMVQAELLKANQIGDTAGTAKVEFAKAPVEEVEEVEEVTAEDFAAGDVKTIDGTDYTVADTTMDELAAMVDAIETAAKTGTDQTPIKISFTNADGDQEWTITPNNTGGNASSIQQTKTDGGATTTAVTNVGDLKTALAAGAGFEITISGGAAAGANSTNIHNGSYKVAGDDVEGATIVSAEKMAELVNATNTPETPEETAAEPSNVFEITTGSAEVAKTLSFNLHVGADADMTNKIQVSIEAMTASYLGVAGLDVTDTTGMDATYAVDAIQDAIQKISTQRSALGAIQNRLEHTIANLDNVVENTTAAESQIRDTDMATEMVKFSNNNILAQAGQAMLAQANQANQGVLSLLG